MEELDIGRKRVLKCTLKKNEDSQSDVRQDHDICLFSTMSGMALQPTQPPVTSTSPTVSPGVKRPAREDTRLTPQSSEVKNKCSNKSTCLRVVHRENFLHRTRSDVLEYTQMSLILTNFC